MDHGPCDTCQCICSGAVIESQEDEVRRPIEAPLCEAILIAGAIADSLRWSTQPTAPPGEQGVAAGRCLRILHASMLL